MRKGFFVSEQTDDRQYFTIVPNFIVNHSTCYEQSAYLVMKRLAGEYGTCFATQKTIGRMLGLSQPMVSRTIKKLLNRGWIKVKGTKKTKTRPVTEYQIVDLWKMNVNYYHKKIVQPRNISPHRDSATTEYKIVQPQHTEEDIHIKKNIKKNMQSIKEFLIERGAYEHPTASAN